MNDLYKDLYNRAQELVAKPVPVANPDPLHNTTTIKNNGKHDVSSYAEANIEVDNGGGGGTEEPKFATLTISTDSSAVVQDIGYNVVLDHYRLLRGDVTLASQPLFISSILNSKTVNIPVISINTVPLFYKFKISKSAKIFLNKEITVTGENCELIHTYKDESFNYYLVRINKGSSNEYSFKIGAIDVIE